MADLIVTLLFYAFCLAGSVTTGYVLLRLAYPDVRTMEHNQKLGASAAAGAAILITSIIICVLAFDVNSIIELNSPLFLVTALIFTLSLVSLKAYFTFLNPQKYVTVAVPIPTPAASKGKSSSISVIASIEAQTAPKTQLEKLARSATEGSTIIQVPIRKEDTTPQSMPSFEMIVPQKGDAKPLIKEEKKTESTKSITARSAPEKKEEYTSMATPDANKETTPWWRRKRDTNQTETQTVTQIPNKETTSATKTQPAVSGDWKRPRADTTRTATANKPVDEVDAILADVVKDTKVKAQTQQQSGSPVHRRYLLGKDSVQVIAPKTAANSSEFNEMIQDVYSQLKTAKDANPTTPVATNATQVVDKKVEEKKQPAKTQTPTKPGELSIQDILGGTNTPTDSTQPTGVFAQLDATVNPGEGTSLFGQLAEISGGKSKAEKAAATTPAKQADVQNVKIAAEKDMACPTCRAKNTKIVFCPYCGAGMCANCSPKIKPVGPGQFLYTCPKCGEEINVKTR